jgi:hypothetical protein
VASSAAGAAKARIEVRDVIRQYAAPCLRQRGQRVTTAEKQMLRALAACRTAQLGGHLETCDHCGYQQPVYNSCRNRHCPKCQAAARGAWLEARRAELLPVEYFHVVFTLPQAMAQIAFQNKRVVYGLLFRAAAETLLEVAADPKHLGAHIGFLCVLHTWGQNLLHHPHVHCVVPGGGLAPDRSRWLSCRAGFFLPVRVLSRVFRGKFLAHLRSAFQQGALHFRGHLPPWADPKAFAAVVREAYRYEWVVHAKPPFGGPEQVLKYLARYTHRVAISNDRLLALENDRVTFRWKNYAASGRIQTMTVSAIEFLRRFLLHVLPGGFVRIRHYGILANCNRQTALPICQALLGVTSPLGTSHTMDEAPSEMPDQPADVKTLCPRCRWGAMLVTETWNRPTSLQLARLWPFDTS